MSYIYSVNLTNVLFVFDLRGWVGVHPVHAALEDKITAQVPPPFQLLCHVVIHLVPAKKI